MYSESASISIQHAVRAALDAFQAGDYQTSIDRLLQSGVAPHSAELSYLLGAALVSTRDFETSLVPLDRALRLKPDFSDAWCSRGMALHGLDRETEALAAFDRAIGLQNDYFDAWLHRANSLLALERAAESLDACDAALRLRPGEPGALNQRGLVLHAMERHQEALVAFAEALAAREDFAEAWMNQGVALAALGRHEEAVAAYEKAIDGQPDDPAAWFNRANTFMALGRLDEAEACLDRALTLQEKFPQAWYNRALVFEKQERWEKAVESLDRALDHQPVFPEAAHNRAVMLYKLGRLDDAIASHDRALIDRPIYPGCWCNRGVVLQESGRLEEALASYEIALRQQPTFHEARVNRGVVHLMQGRLRAGWPDYEARWLLEEMRETLARRPWPRHAGEDLQDRVLAVFCEQGLGDIVQFARYLPLIRGKASKVIFVAPAKMHRLLRPLVEGIDVRAALAPGETIDFHTTLMSLPSVFETARETIPGVEKPYLFAEPDVLSRWRRRIEAGCLRIGVVWQGNPHWKVDHGRSFPLACLAPVAAIPGVRLIALQKNDGLEQIAHLPAGMRVETPGPDFDAGPDAFIDTAAVASLVDLIITSDTSVAHVAGALGCPVWVALKRVPEWRWMPSGEESPWYPTMRLFRQTRDGGWLEVFETIASAVQGLRPGAPFSSAPCSRAV